VTSTVENAHKQSTESNQSKLHQTNMPPPPKRKKNKNRYRHVSNNSHSVVLHCHSPHSVMSAGKGQNVVQSGWNYQDYRAAFHGYNNQSLSYREVQRKMSYSASQFEDDLPLDVMKETQPDIDSGEHDIDSVHAVNGTMSTGIQLSLNQISDVSTNEYNLGMSLPSTVSALAPQSRQNKKSPIDNALIEGDESENDDEGVDLEKVKKEINELMGHDDTKGGKYEDEDHEDHEDVDFDELEKSSYVKRFDTDNEDDAYSFPKVNDQLQHQRKSIIDETYLKYLE